mgnify:CR=1 FL=1
MSEKKREVNAFGKRNPFTSIIKGNIGISIDYYVRNSVNCNG